MEKLTEAQARILRAMADGGHIEDRLVVATRTKGGKWSHYRPLYAADNETLVREVAKPTLATLVASGLVEWYARPDCMHGQGLSYRISEAGRVALAASAPEAKEPQPRYTYSLYEWRPDEADEADEDNGEGDNGESVEVWQGEEEAEAIAQYSRHATDDYAWHLKRYEWRYVPGQEPEIVAAAVYDDEREVWEE